MRLRILAYGAAIPPARRAFGRFIVRLMRRLPRRLLKKMATPELAAYPSARANFEAFPASVKKMILGWIQLAKRAETRAARVSEAARLASEGIRVNEWRSKHRDM